MTKLLHRKGANYCTYCTISSSAKCLIPSLRCFDDWLIRFGSDCCVRACIMTRKHLSSNLAHSSKVWLICEFFWVAQLLYVATPNSKLQTFCSMCHFTHIMCHFGYRCKKTGHYSQDILFKFQKQYIILTYAHLCSLMLGNILLRKMQHYSRTYAGIYAAGQDQ